MKPFKVSNFQRKWSNCYDLHKFPNETGALKIVKLFVSRKNNNKKKCINTTLCKGHPPIVDLRYGEEDIISPSTLILAAIKG